MPVVNSFVDERMRRMTLADVGSEMELSPQELQRLRSENPALAVLDCREPSECTLSSLPGTLDIPMGQIPDRIAELNPGEDLVVMCHHGVRSLRVVQWLRRQGNFSRVKSLRGGIEAWSSEIDPEVPRY